jgi:cell division protease FtsH
MVTRWGMSDALGPLQYSEPQGETFLGYSSNQPIRMSNETAKLIDSEIKAIVEGAYNRAKQLLSDHIGQLHSLAQALLEYETLSGEEIKKVLAGEPIDREDPSARRSLPIGRGGSSIPRSKRPGEFGGAAPQGA